MTADRARLKALAQAALDAPAMPAGQTPIAVMDFVDEASPAAVLDLLARLATATQHQTDLRTQLQRCHAQVRGLQTERDQAITERNAALVRAITAEQRLARKSPDACICPSCFMVLDPHVNAIDPDDELDDVLPLRTPLHINLPESLDLADSEGGHHD